MKAFVAAILVGLMVLVSLRMASARLPAQGNHVEISTGSGGITYEGTIAEIGNVFIDLKCDRILSNIPEGEQNTIANFNPQREICIGIGSIIGLEWI